MCISKVLTKIICLKDYTKTNVNNLIWKEIFYESEHLTESAIRKCSGEKQSVCVIMSPSGTCKKWFNGSFIKIRNIKL